MSCPLPIVPVIQTLPTINTQPDYPIHIGIKVSFESQKACRACPVALPTDRWRHALVASNSERLYSLGVIERMGE
jgi:hypothetical protein